MKISAILFAVCLICCAYTQAAPTKQTLYPRLPADLYDVIKNQARHWCCLVKPSVRDIHDTKGFADKRYRATDVDDASNCPEKYRRCCNKNVRVSGMCIPIDVATKNLEVLKELKNSGFLPLFG